MTEPEKAAVSFQIWNMETRNMLGYFDDRALAESILALLCEANPDLTFTLIELPVAAAREPSSTRP